MLQNIGIIEVQLEQIGEPDRDAVDKDRVDAGGVRLNVGQNVPRFFDREPRRIPPSPMRLDTQSHFFVERFARRHIGDAAETADQLLREPVAAHATGHERGSFPSKISR